MSFLRNQMASTMPPSALQQMDLLGGQMGGDGGPERATRSVFVGNIPYEATEEQLKDIFLQAGPVVSFRLVYDRETGKPKGYGFCEYQDTETAQSAMRNLNNHDFNGRPLRVGVAAGENSKDDMKMGIAGQMMESPYGDPVEPEKAPEAISQAVASLPPEQMFELMKQMKLCIQNNPNEARNMLLANPQLAYALLQAQIVMKIVDPQVALTMLYRENDPTPANIPQNNPPQIQQNMGMGPGQQVGGPRPLIGAVNPQMGGQGPGPQMGVPRPLMGGPSSQMSGAGPQMGGPGLQMGVPRPLMGGGNPQMGGNGPQMGRGPPGPGMMTDMRGPPTSRADGGGQFPGPMESLDPRMMSDRNMPNRSMASNMPISGGMQPNTGGIPGLGGMSGGAMPNLAGLANLTSGSAGTQISSQDQEKAALIMQVLQLTDQQIAILPPEQRQSILILKDQIAKSAQ